jgi:tripartite-type tricarboxylate transporter receptor subunit TctC
MTIWMTFGKKRAPDFPNVPTIYEVAKNQDDRMLAELVFEQSAIGRPLAGPPALPAANAKALRRGFDAAMTDAALQKEAKRLRLGIKPMTGEETEKRFKEFYAFPKPVVDRFLSITATKKKKKK